MTERRLSGSTFLASSDNNANRVERQGPPSQVRQLKRHEPQSHQVPRRVERQRQPEWRQHPQSKCNSNSEPTSAKGGVREKMMVRYNVTNEPYEGRLPAASVRAAIMKARSREGATGASSRISSAPSMNRYFNSGQIVEAFACMYATSSIGSARAA